ncbi:MAG TPA: flagellar biosynthetic protein FliO [Bradyrhizobium sp.]|nr:flagellar biosynthetic protein FliO [Bradyrhizobium sp.]
MQALTFFFAFVVVLALIGVVAWLVRRFAGNRLGANPNRSRMPRLAVIDAAAVDGRRRLVLVRRDNIEHLLMIGGPTDIVVEPNIVRAMPGRDQLPPRSAVASPEMPPRIAPLPEPNGWADTEGPRAAEPLEHIEPQMPEPRPARASFAEEARRAAPERRPERGDPLAGFAPEPMGGRPDIRPEPAPRMPTRSEPLLPRSPRATEAPKPVARPAERSAAPPPPPAAAADQNLAEMAQRLEAALRRPASDTMAPPVAPEPPSSRAAPRAEPAVAPPVLAPSRSGFENLEDEMASLLGRPKNPS